MILRMTNEQILNEFVALYINVMLVLKEKIFNWIQYKITHFFILVIYSPSSFLLTALH